MLGALLRRGIANCTNSPWHVFFGDVVKGKWPNPCVACTALLKESGFPTEESLKACYQKVSEKVIGDLAQFAEGLLRKDKNLKPLKPPAKREPEPLADAPAAKRVKQETDVKEEPSDDDVDQAVAEVDVQGEPNVDINAEPTDEAEALMSKNSLLTLHGMRKMPSGDSGKKWPVWCRFCNKTRGQGQGQGLAACERTGAPSTKASATQAGGPKLQGWCEA